jgi:hypothetical protein
MRAQHEAGDTVQFTFTTSVAPDAAPSFAVVGGSDALVSSATALSSGTTAYYAMYTMPNSADGVYMGEWLAQKTVSGTPYQFRKRFLFNVVTTRRVP